MFSILLLDDEPNVLSALRKSLREPLGPHVTLETFTDPHEALSRVGRHDFDLIVADLQMPRMNGIEFLQAAREIQPTAPRMLLGASTEIDGMTTAIDAVGVIRCLVKPWASEVLVGDVCAALGESIAAREDRRRSATCSTY